MNKEIQQQAILLDENMDVLGTRERYFINTLRRICDRYIEMQLLFLEMAQSGGRYSATINDLNLEIAKAFEEMDESLNLLSEAKVDHFSILGRLVHKLHKEGIIQ